MSRTRFGRWSSRYTGVRNRGINPQGFHVSQIKFYIVLAPLVFFMLLPVVFIFIHVIGDKVSSFSGVSRKVQMLPFLSFNAPDRLCSPIFKETNFILCDHQRSLTNACRQTTGGDVLHRL